MVRVTRTQDWLEHHGIKGQHWGVRNGPPYPLSFNDHSPAQKRLNPKSALDNYSKSKDTAGGPILDAVAYTAVLAAYVGLVAYAAKKADQRRTEQFDKEYYQNRKIKSLEECPKIDPESMSMDEHMKEINPDYPEVGSTDNCMFCTTAMAMRMKGYDVIAEKCPDGWTSKNLSSTWTNFESEKPKAKSTSALEDYIKGQGDGAYGNIMVFWNAGGGHSMFYKVDNGKVKIYDTQANKERELRDFSHVIRTSSTEIIRLDDKEPTEMALGCVKERSKAS